MGKHLYTHFVQFSSVRTLPEAEKQQHVGAVVTQPTGSLKHRGVARIRALVGYRHNCNLQLTVPAVQGDTVVRTFPGAERQGRVARPAHGLPAYPLPWIASTAVDLVYTVQGRGAAAKAHQTLFECTHTWRSSFL